MISVIFFLKRKDGVTREQFRHHFENVHVKLAEKHFTHLFVHYTRKYIGEVTLDVYEKQRPIVFDYDCISEWTLPDEATLEKVWSIFAIPEVGREFYEDEENFLNREATMMIRCNEGDIIVDK